MAEKIIKVGSKVMWRGDWGAAPAVETTVESIERTKHPHEKDGTSVDSIPFSEREFSVMSLSNEHWCYGNQIVDVLD
jgi:hypothetical protein